MAGVGTDLCDAKKKKKGAIIWVLFIKQYCHPIPKFVSRAWDETTPAGDPLQRLSSSEATTASAVISTARSPSSTRQKDNRAVKAVSPRVLSFFKTFPLYIMLFNSSCHNHCTAVCRPKIWTSCVFVLARSVCCLSFHKRGIPKKLIKVFYITPSPPCVQRAIVWVKAKKSISILRW